MFACYVTADLCQEISDCRVETSEFVLLLVSKRLVIISACAYVALLRTQIGRRKVAEETNYANLTLHDWSPPFVERTLRSNLYTGIMAGKFWLHGTNDSGLLSNGHHKEGDRCMNVCYVMKIF